MARTKARVALTRLEEAGLVRESRPGHFKLPRRAVKPGDARGNDVEVLAGLSEGDQVVVSNVKDLRDRQRVVVKK